MIDPTAHIRIARPSKDLAAAEQFYVAGLGLEVLFRASGGRPGEHDLLMLGWRNASWHLELVAGDEAVPPQPSQEDLLVIYLAGPVDQVLVDRLVAAGGRQLSQSEYWDRWGVTVADPDGYRLVLSTRSWSNAE
ncbi:VOC family protein [Saccharopolyspora sp. K220]|uniref:VOC family protein n=1 Tax=Saccharopolyspora soli TaxID=2926618 RepID=UPI001F5940E2|nr:VOC family protein [Saccharopolyspora soli]MCI2423573.1 VOC family protein [Saccharopolyspora soli]